MAKFELPKLKPVDEIKHDQDVIGKNLGELDRMIHDNMIQCYMHCAQHRDTSLMVRLMNDIIVKDKNGYRRQGIIAHMKYFTPMRLSGNTIKLSGKDEKTGKEADFRLEQAAQTPFWELTTEGPAILKPMYQDGTLGMINRAIASFQKAVANTNEQGLPIDPTKPFYSGKNLDAMNNFVVSVKQLEAVIPIDDTKERVEAQRKQAEAGKQAA